MDLLPNQTLVFQWFIFITAALALHWGVFRPVIRILSLREEKTVGEQERTVQLIKRGERLANDYARKIDEARTLGGRERGSVLREAEEFQRQTLQQAKEEVNRQIESLRLTLEREARQASIELKKYSNEAAQETVEKILERKLS
ncbi:MAG: ATP synthase F0 subunit B [Deltaproteobacteria bacterium]|nr:ATP synthase F0 subunit B [Deltaproteobacteria bacterium]MBI4196807.1 ATP synthase F0 subunit B [Deltaproteobacteria bacterium]